MATNWQQVARQLAQRYGINPTYFLRQIHQESGFNPNAVSPAGALGIAQIMPATARSWGVNPMDPRAALAAAAQHDRYYLQQYHGDWRKVLAAYNAGPGAVASGAYLHYPETINYIHTILNGGNPYNFAHRNAAISPGGGGGGGAAARFVPQPIMVAPNQTPLPSALGSLQRLLAAQAPQQAPLVPFQTSTAPLPSTYADQLDQIHSKLLGA